MKIVICDDNDIFGNELLTFIKTTAVASHYYDDDFRFTYIDSAKKLLEYLTENDIDILFLDISMPEMDGFDVAKELCRIQKSICLIFVSGFENNVFYSFRFNPFRFVRKSNYQNEIPEALQSAIEILTRKKDFIILSKRNDRIMIRLNKILYAEKEKRSNYLLIHCLGDTYRYRGSIAEFYAQVKNHSFVQISSNVIINLEYVDKVEKKYVYLSDGRSEKITTSEYQNEFFKRYLQYMRVE